MLLKECGPQKSQGEKRCDPRWRLRNGCDGRLMAKILITTIQVNLVPNSIAEEATQIHLNSPELS